MAQTESAVFSKVEAATLLPLELRQALAWTLLHHPGLDAYSKEVRAREAEMIQAGLRPNPFLSFEAENVFGSGMYSGTDAAELTVSLRQEIELGGKRSKRQGLAAAEVDVAHSEYLVAKADHLARTAASFAGLLAAQERQALADELTTLAERMLEDVRERIAAGKTAAAESGRARILLREMEIAKAKARREVAAARRTLAAGMGRETADFGTVAGDLAQLPHPPPLAELEGLIDESPQIAILMHEIKRRERAVALERARRLPDLEVGLGTRYDRESEDTALLFGLSMPLPLFNRNQGAVAAARSRLAGAEAKKQGAVVQVKAALAENWETMAAAHEEAEILREEVLPTARQALEDARYGYEAGKFGLLEVLDAQRTLVEARGSYLEALSTFHRTAAEMGRLLGPNVPGSTLPSLSSIQSRSIAP
jgi:cobalt-zinc-cadmium efflux system outer membrane protein